MFTFVKVAVGISIIMCLFCRLDNYCTNLDALCNFDTPYSSMFVLYARSHIFSFSFPLTIMDEICVSYTCTPHHNVA